MHGTAASARSWSATSCATRRRPSRCATALSSSKRQRPPSKGNMTRHTTCNSVLRRMTRHTASNRRGRPRSVPSSLGTALKLHPRMQRAPPEAEAHTAPVSVPLLARRLGGRSAAQSCRTCAFPTLHRVNTRTFLAPVVFSRLSYFKMHNCLIDDRRIVVNFCQVAPVPGRAAPPTAATCASVLSIIRPAPARQCVARGACFVSTRRRIACRASKRASTLARAASAICSRKGWTAKCALALNALRALARLREGRAWHVGPAYCCAERAAGGSHGAQAAARDCWRAIRKEVRHGIR